MSREVLVKDKKSAAALCGKCGFDVRAGSLYCYNCGGKVENGDGAASPSPSRVTYTEPTRFKRAGDRSRNRRVVRQKKNVEVSWTPSDGPGYFFLFIALGIALFVAILLGIAFYLK